ncbi:MAG: HNH endonuclease [Bdellovibrionota bacterium]
MIHEKIHQKALLVSQRFKASEIELQEVLREVDHHNVYLHYKHSSLYRYAVDALGLSSDVAYNHIAVVRKSIEIPALRAAINQGEITVSQARHISSALNQENQNELLGLAKNSSREVLKKELARIAPEMAAPSEKARYVSEERMALEIRVSETLMKKLRRAQDLVSQSDRKFSSLEETLEAMTETFLEKKDPLRKAQRAQAKTSDAAAPKTCTVQVEKGGRMSIPAAIRHQVLFRDQGRCTENSLQGERCPATRWLHFHHLMPIAEGGGNTVENLKLLCSGHHRGFHWRVDKITVLKRKSILR